MIGQYRVNIYHPQTGALEATVEDWQRLNMKQVLNGVGTCTIQLYGGHPAIPKLVNNALIEVWRQIPGYAPAAVPAVRQRTDNWYCEWNGLFTDYSETIFSNGNDVYTAYCDGLVDLLQRREILWYATQVASESKKVAIPAQTAMYEFVEENCGASAVAGIPGVGRLFTGTITGLAIPVLTGAGDNWSGQRAWMNLLETLQLLANYGGIDFDVVSTGGGNYTFLTYPDQLGEDRTTTGLDPTTGLNAAGYPPVIFSLELNNISEITLSTSRSASKNIVATPGKGEYTARAVGTATDLTDIDARRLNQRELVRNANTQDDAAELDSLAEEWRVKLEYSEDFRFTPLITDSTLYGVHYWFGDKMTGRFKTLERNKRLTGLSIVVDRNGEQFSGWNFETLPV